MASDKERPSIPWREDKPAFHVTREDPDALRARRHFHKPHLYYVGSDEGCGCGFQREHDRLSETPEERGRTRANQENLADYLRQCLEDEEEIELYGCWSGDEGEEATSERDLPLDSLLSDSFAFVESQRIRIHR